MDSKEERIIAMLQRAAELVAEFVKKQPGGEKSGTLKVAQGYPELVAACFINWLSDRLSADRAPCEAALKDHSLMLALRSFTAMRQLHSRAADDCAPQPWFKGTSSDPECRSR